MNKQLSLLSLLVLSLAFFVSCGTAPTASTPVEVKDEGFDPATMNAKLVEPKDSFTSSGTTLPTSSSSGMTIKMNTNALDK